MPFSILKFALIALFTIPFSVHARHRILIDPGHGGRDIGAQVGRYKESEVVWQWALALKKDLIERGFEVALSRNETGRIDHEKRMALARNPRFDLIISLHANYLQDVRVKGVEYFLLNPLSFEDQKLQLAHEEMKLTKKLKSAPQEQSVQSFDKQAQLMTILEDLKKQALLKRSLKVAKILHDDWKGKLKQGPFDILSQAQAPAVLIELGFLSSPVDQKNLTDSRFISAQSQIMARSLARFFSEKETLEMNP